MISKAYVAEGSNKGIYEKDYEESDRNHSPYMLWLRRFELSVGFWSDRLTCKAKYCYREGDSEPFWGKIFNI